MITDQKQSPSGLRIFPIEGSRMSIPFSTLINIEENSENTDYSDLYILQVHSEDFQKNGDATLTAQRVVN